MKIIQKSLILDANEFDEDYKDDLADDVDYNEITTKSTRISLSSTLSIIRCISSYTDSYIFRFSNTSTNCCWYSCWLVYRNELILNKRLLFLGLAIGILTSVILLICLVQRFHTSKNTFIIYNRSSLSKSIWLFQITTRILCITTNLNTIYYVDFTANSSLRFFFGCILFLFTNAQFLFCFCVRWTTRYLRFNCITM